MAEHTMALNGPPPLSGLEPGHAGPPPGGRASGPGPGLCFAEDLLSVTDSMGGLAGTCGAAALRPRWRRGAGPVAAGASSLQPCRRQERQRETVAGPH